MKVTITCLILSLFTYPLLCQSAFLDAIALSQYIKASSYQSTEARFDPAQAENVINKAVPILMNYTSDPASIEELPDLNDAFDGNPFIGPDNGVSKVLLPNVFQAAAFANFTGPKSVSTNTGPSITNIADGLAKFLVKRTKQELTVTFFQSFKDKVDQNEYFHDLFPQTTDLLLLIDSEIYQFNAYMETLREHFIKDMKSLPINVKSTLRNNKLLNDPEQIIADDMMSIAQMLLDNQPPESFITYIGSEAQILNQERLSTLPDETRRKFEDAGAGFQVAHLLSESLRSNTSDNIWVKPEEFRELLNNKITFYLYLGLLWQKSEGITFHNGQSVHSVLNSVAQTSTHYTMMKRQLTDFVSYAHEVNVSLDSIKAKKSRNDLVYNDYYQFIHSTFSLLETGIRFKKDFFSQDDVALQVDEQIITVFRHFNELNFNVRQKHYAAAVSNLVYVFQSLLDKKNFKFKDDLLKYGNFMAIVAEAENSDEVAAAIEAVALPVGSSLTKKYASFSVTVTAFTGLAGGQEVLNESGAGEFIAVAAPVGFSVDYGMNEAGSLGLFTSLFDVGALAALRFQDDTTSDLPDLELQNILAPGAYLVYGFGGDIPLALGVGAQLGPNLRAIETGNSMSAQFDNGWRWGAFLTVDIPIFNLYIR